MKGRGIALVVALIVVAIGAALWFMKFRRSDTTATAPVAARNGSAVVASAPKIIPRSPGRITITVTDDRGPIGDAFVRLAPEDGEVIAVKTGADGVAIADQLAAGTYEVSASAAGHEPGAIPAHELAAGEDAKLAITLVAGGRSLSGTVTDVTGGPIAGARIDAARLGAMARPDRAVATALTGADGKYQLAVPEGQLLVAARSADYAAQSRLVDVGPTGAVADFALIPGGVIEGVVLDEKTRTPIAGAIVDARRDSAAILLAETGGSIAIADAAGKFRMTGLRPGAYELGARGEGRRSKSPTIVGLGIAEQVTDVEILVGTTPSVHGTVVDEAGAPIAGARVMAMGRGAGESVKSDAKGAFAIEGLLPGKYMLIGTSPEQFGDPVPIELAETDVDGVVLRMRAGVRIKGHVEPRQVADVRVEPQLDPGAAGMRMMMMATPTTTGPDGEFTLGPVEAGKVTLSGRGPSGDQGSLETVVAAGMPEVVLKLAPGASISGRVLDADGKPVAGVHVLATPQDGGEHTMIVNGMITSGVKALTNGSGAYQLRGLAAGSYRLGALDRGRPMPPHGKSPRVKLGAAETKTGVDFAVERPNGVIKGVVTGPDGKPLADAWVSVHQDLEAMIEGLVGDRDGGEPGSQQTTMMSIDSDDDDSGGAVTSAFPPAITDAQGRFELRNLPRAKYEVLAEAQAGKVRGRAHNIEPDATVAITAMGVTSLSGTVKGPKGPSALFTIELEGPTRAQRTFTNGAFELGRVDPGNYTVRVSSSDGNADVQVEVKPGMPATVEIALVANAVVVGTIVDGAGKPKGGVPVVIVDDAGDGQMRISIEGPPLTSGPDGKFRIEHKAGGGALVVMVPPSPVIKRGLVLEAGKTLDVGPIRLEVTPPPP